MSPGPIPHLAASDDEPAERVCDAVLPPLRFDTSFDHLTDHLTKTSAGLNAVDRGIFISRRAWSVLNALAMCGRALSGATAGQIAQFDRLIESDRPVDQGRATTTLGVEIEQQLVPSLG